LTTITTPVAPTPPAGGVRVPIRIRSRRAPGDIVFRGVTTVVAYLTFLILILIGVFLFIRAWPAFKAMGWSFFTTSSFVTQGAHPKFGVKAALFGSVLIAIIAVIVAVPVSIASALFINEFAPRKMLGFPLKGFLTSLVDLMAAVPSIIYGLWGFFVLQSHMKGLARWLATHLAFIPLFRTTTVSPVFTSSALIAGVLVSIMIMPIVTSLSREVFSLTPIGEREGALALGASRARVIREIVLPFGRAGIIGAAMLGLGRALGEAVAVSLIISIVFQPQWHILQAGSNSIAALIAARFGSGGPLGLAALLAMGLVLFFFTLIVNLVASRIVASSRVSSR